MDEHRNPSAAISAVPLAEADPVHSGHARGVACWQDPGLQAPMSHASWIARSEIGHRRRSLTGGDAPSERALVRAAQHGSEEAVEELFTRHWTDAYRSAFLVTADRAAAEDIAQEAFLSALRALPNFDLRRPLRPWLHRIVVNRAIDWTRSRALRGEVDAEAIGETAAPPADKSGIGEEVVAALGRLSAEQRAVVVLRYLLDFTPGEIGRILELPRGTVNSRLRRGLDALGDDIQREHS